MTQDSGDMSIVCRLSNPELRKREATLLAQFKSVVIMTEELADGYVFRIFGDKQEMFLVCELILAERECCPFLKFELCDRSNDERAIGLSVRSVTWISNDQVELRGGMYCGGLCADAGIYRLAKKNGRWAVEQYEAHMQA